MLKFKNTKLILLAIQLTMGFIIYGAMFMPASVGAVLPPEDTSGSQTAPTTPSDTTPAITRDADKAFLACSAGDASTGCGFVDKYVNPGINLLAGAVGMAVTIMIIIGGIQYSSAGGDPNKVAAAKSKIMNSVIALVAFLFLYSAIQFLVPGGVF